jgi:hypothetical protein
VIKEGPRRRWDELLRKKMRVQPLTFQAAVDLKIGAVDPMQSERGPVNFRVHGDLFEVVSAIPIFRLLNGADFRYPAMVRFRWLGPLTGPVTPRGLSRLRLRRGTGGLRGRCRPGRAGVQRPARAGARPAPRS